MGKLTSNKKIFEENIKKAEFEFMMDLKTLISKTATETELTNVRNSMRREDREITPDGYKLVFNILSIRWGLVFVDDQIVVSIELRRRLLNILHLGHAGMTKMETEQRYSGGRQRNPTSRRKIKTGPHALLQVKTSNIKYQVNITES